MTSDPLDVLDLDAEAATRREGGNKPLQIKWRGDVLYLPGELPIDVFAPVKNLNLNITMLVQQAVDMMGAEGDRAKQKDALDVMVALLADRPALPTEMIDAITAMGRTLFDSDTYPGQWDKFVAGRPSKDDAAALAKGLFKKYGVSLGEASASTSDSTDAGETPKPTSSDTSASTSDAASATPTDPAS